VSQSGEHAVTAPANLLQFKVRRRRSLTADEFVRRLESDPEWVAKRDRREAERMKRVEENLRVEAPIVADLARSGIVVNSIEDFCIRNLSHEERGVVRILLKWIPRLGNLDVKSAIVTALRDKMARPSAGPPLITEFRTVAFPPAETEMRFQHYKCKVADTIRFVATKHMHEDIVELIRDRRHGWSRGPLVLALQRMKNPATVGVLMDALDEDPNLNEEKAALITLSLRALGNMKAHEARPKIELFLKHTSDVVRKEAQRSLGKLDRAQAKSVATGGGS
jgi:hypothetical protein